MSFQVDMDLTSAPFTDAVYYVSDTPSTWKNDRFYQPYIIAPPFIELGDYDAGWLNVNVGNLQLVNRPNDASHPFSGANYTALLSSPATAIPVILRYNGKQLLDGTAILNNLTPESLSFQLEAKVQRTNLLRLIVAETSSKAELIEAKNNGAGKIRITTAALHNFGLGEQAFFQGMSIVGEELEYNPSDTATQFTITDVTDTTFDINVDVSTITYTNPSSGNYSFDSGTELTATETFSISQSLESICTISTGITITVAQSVILAIQGDAQLPQTYSVSSGNTITIIFGSTVSVSGLNAYDIGNASATDTQLPFAFGTVTLQEPVPILNAAKTQVGNPNLQTTSASVQDDGQDEVLNASLSYDFYTVPDGEVPRFTLQSGSLEGEASISGISIHFDTTNGDENAYDFFGWLAQSIGYSYDSSLASNANNDDRKVSIFETNQQRILDFADQVAKALNMQFYLDDENDVLHLIDRENVPGTASLTLEDYEILSSQIDLPAPLSGLLSSNSYNLAVGAGLGANPYKLLKVERAVRVANIDTGRDDTIRTFSPSIEVAAEVLTDIIAVKNKPRLSVTIDGINLDVQAGERIDVNNKTLGITGNMIVRKRAWDFVNETTTFSGDSTLTPLSI